MVNVKEKNQIYKCNVCGNMVETVHVGGGELVCCNQPMQLLEENKTDAATEKHVPVIEATENGVVVKVGSVAHPMEDKHFIEWIEIMTKDGKVGRKYLSPGDAPEAEFNMPRDNIVKAREFCNLHGLWSAE